MPAEGIKKIFRPSDFSKKGVAHFCYRKILLKTRFLKNAKGLFHKPCHMRIGWQYQGDPGVTVDHRAFVSQCYTFFPVARVMRQVRRHSQNRARRAWFRPRIDVSANCARRILRTYNCVDHAIRRLQEAEGRRRSPASPGGAGGFNGDDHGYGHGKISPG